MCESRQRLKNKARYWHFNFWTAVSENAKGWMSALSYIEAKFDFSIDDYKNAKES